MATRAGDPFADRLNAMPKYVASRTLRDASWNASILDGDVAARVADLKASDGQDILKYGTGELDRTLLGHDLIDELHLWMFPVIAGGGQRLLDDVETTHLELVDTTRFRSGIVVLTYTPKRDLTARRRPALPGHGRPAHANDIPVLCARLVGDESFGRDVRCALESAEHGRLGPPAVNNG